jgi:hypothetical protein
MKAFKYFDLNDNGSVEPDEFAKAIEKIGIQIPTKKVRTYYLISILSILNMLLSYPQNAIHVFYRMPTLLNLFRT